MMGSENHDYEDPQFFDSSVKMENLVLDEPSPSVGPSSYGDYRSAMTSLTDTHHPLSSSTLDADTVASSEPFLSPLPPIALKKNPSSHSDNSLLDPPSYADVVFSPLADNDRSANGESGISRSSSSSSGPGEYVRITVSDPQKEQETSSNSIVPSGNTYWTYHITTRTNSPEFGAGVSEFAVRRRFRDVVTLADRLAETYRGFFIPPRPDKSVVESQVMQKQEFVKQRQAALEKYLARLVAHPVIGKSEELKVFLMVNGRLPLPTTNDVASRMLGGAMKLPKQLFGDSGAVLGPHEVVQPAKGGRDLLRIFKELKQSVANDWGGTRPPVVEEDKEFLEKKEKMQELEQQLSNASQQAEALVKAQQDIGETMGELGLAFVKLTKFENEEALFNSQRIRAADTKRVATSAVKASRFYRELNAQTVNHLDTLHEYLGLMMAVHTAFSDRSSALLTVQTLLSELSSLHSRAEKLEVSSLKIFGGDRSRIRKIEEMKEAITATEDAKNVAIREYEWIKENNRVELERLDLERHDSFLDMFKGFVINQVGYAEKIASVWSKVAEETSGYARES
ncbi:sorting nexin 2B-like [Aristolochia californica]|uniref:sorting nexin 2B-like n=1 Tax=Aristolochia californica TaxID=171875 RepID=UPI0035D8EF3C